jgi:hypothetical protein
MILFFRAQFGQPEVFYEFQTTNKNPNKFKPTKIKTIERKIIFLKLKCFFVSYLGSSLKIMNILERKITENF